MKSERVRAASLRVALALAVASIAPAASAQTKPTPSAEELKAARELFQDAYRDEKERRFPQALEKFERVAAVKESASVRYRIATVLGSLGRLRESRDAFRALAASKSSLPANEQEISDSAAERAQALDRRIPRLVLQLQDGAAPDARVTIDGATVPASVTPRPFELDPGEHVVQGSAPTAQPSETRVTLQEGGEVSVTVVLPPKASRVAKVTPPPPRPEERVPDAAPPADRTLALVALGAGGVMLVTGVVLLLVREGEVSDLKKACSPTCPSSNRSELESKHDDAQLFGPLGVGFAAVGLAAAGFGAYLLLRPHPKSVAAAFRIGATPVRNGGLVGVGTAF
jgi:hypothetical protein